MSKPKIVLTVAAATALLGLAACNHDGASGFASASSLAPPSSGSSHALVFSDDGANAKLALAEQPAALMLECAHGSKTVHVTHASTGGPAPTMILASGGAASPMAADRQSYEGQTLALGETTLDEPALAAFRKSGRISVRYGDEGLTADAHPDAFFAACEKES